MDWTVDMHIDLIFHLCGCQHPHASLECNNEWSHMYARTLPVCVHVAECYDTEAADGSSETLQSIVGNHLGSVARIPWPAVT